MSATAAGTEPILPPQGHIDAGGHRIAYRVDGDRGSYVLLVMGFAMPGRAWQFQVPALSERHRVITFDNRGAGASDVPRGPYSMQGFAADAVALLDHLGVDAAHVVGVSMGGMIAQELALQSPKRVRSLTLIATHAGGFRALLPRPRGLGYFVAAQLGSREKRGHALAQLLFPPDFLATCDRSWLHRTLTQDLGTPPSAAARRAQFAAIFGHRTAARLHRLANLPVLLVRPHHDLLIRPTQTDRLHRALPHARVLHLPGGHGVIRQLPDVLNAAMLDHFATAEGAPA